MNEKPKAFVIMPFGEEFDSLYAQVIRPPLEEVGYEVARADSFLDQENILSSIVRGITNANLVIADLTANNANVFYELGMCHGLNTPTVLLARSIEQVPFDLRSYRLLLYDTHYESINKLKNSLKEIADLHRQERITFRNPLTDFSEKPFSKSLPNATGDVNAENEKENEEKGLWDYLADGENAANRLTAILERLQKENETVTSKIKKHTTSIQVLGSNPVAGTAGKFRTIALLVASDINSFSKNVEELLPQFEKTINELSEDYSGWIDIVDFSLDKDRDSVLKFRGTMEQLLEGTRAANEGMRSYRGAVIDLNTQKISKDLSRATLRQARALDGIIANIERVQDFCVRTVAVLDKKLTRKQDATGMVPSDALQATD